jgi:hypothetical protein
MAKQNDCYCGNCSDEDDSSAEIVTYKIVRKVQTTTTKKKN